jgi:hypothetical protein
MKRITGTGKENLKISNWGYAYANGFVLAEGLDMFRLGAVGKMNCKAICPL